MPWLANLIATWQAPSHGVALEEARAQSAVELLFGEGRLNRVGGEQFRLPMPVFLLCGLPVRLAAIPARFSSSSLPPSFATERRTTAFMQPTGTRSGARFSYRGAVA
jgi:hypothetical protein